MLGKILCTVAILTKNNEATLGRALESVKDFAEIIVCDGGSTDKTLEIASAFGGRVIEQNRAFQDDSGRIKDFAGVHNQMLRASKYDWHFYLDSDEVMTPKLATELDVLIRANRSMAVWVDRKYEIDGKVIDCAATYPTRQMRFFHKDAVTEFIKPIHERINPKPNAVIKTTKNFMLVPVSADPRVWREKWKNYIGLEVARRGKISFGVWLGVCLECLKISLLYAVRYMIHMMFCRNKIRMPWPLERERHIYHFNLCRALWSRVIGL